MFGFHLFYRTYVPEEDEDMTGPIDVLVVSEHTGPAHSKTLCFK